MKLFLTLIIGLIMFMPLNTNAQTKEETIKWINEKIKKWSFSDEVGCKGVGSTKYSTGNLYLAESVNREGSLTITTTFQIRFAIGDGGNTSRLILSASTKDLISATINTTQSYAKGCPEFLVPIELTFRTGKVRILEQIDYYPPKNSNKLFLFLDWSGEENLLERVLKAFKKLIELEGNTSNEAF